MSKNAYDYLNYSQNWLNIKNGTKDVGDILRFKISRWKKSLEIQMSKIEDKASQEYLDLNLVKENLEAATKVDESSRPTSVENLEELKDFLAFGLFCEKISYYESSLIERKQNIKSNDNITKFYFTPQDKCEEVLNEYNKKIEEMQSGKTEEEQASNLELNKIIKDRDLLQKCNESFALIATEDRRIKYNKKLTNMQDINIPSEKIVPIEDIVQEDISKKSEIIQDASEKEGYEAKSAEDEENVKQEFREMPKEVLDVLERSKIFSDGKFEMTKGTSTASSIIKKSLDNAKKYYEENQNSRYLGNLYKWLMYAENNPKIILNENDKSGNRIYVCDYGIFHISSDIKPNKEYPKGEAIFKDYSNHIYGVTTVKKDGTYSQHIVISSENRDSIQNNKEFCTNVFFNEKYIELAESMNSHYIGSFSKESDQDYIIKVNNPFDFKTVNTLNLALMPHAEKAKVDNEKDIESNKQWETYCLGTMEIISTQDSIQYNKVKENIDLQKLFKDLNEKQLNAVLNNIRNNVPDVTSKEKKSDLPDGYDDGPDL
jgi:hypothetical protein